MKIPGRTFLITGGASGLGAAVASRLAKLSAQVVIADRDQAAGEDLADALGPPARFVRTDVTSPEQMQAAVAVATSLGGVHGLIHCAGVILARRVLTSQGPHDLEEFRRVIDVNLVGAFNAVRLAAAAMSQQEPIVEGERGVIVLTSSIAAWDGQVGQAAYAASKGAVAAMTLPLARDLSSRGIRVVSIAPGVFDTPMLGGASAEIRDALAAQVPFPQRLGRPEEFAQLVEQILLNSMLNGETIRLDGALRMAAR